MSCMQNSENIDKSRFHTITPAGKKTMIIVSVLLAFFVLPFAAKIYYKAAINRQAQGFRETTFEIEEGEPVMSISKRLYDEELINSEPLFRIHLMLSGLHTNIQAGTYEIPAGASVVELAQIFQHGTNDIKVTFLEGWRHEQYALEASEKMNKFDYATFNDLAKEKEGYLFPDTYFLNKEATEKEVVDKLTKTFNEKTMGAFNKVNLEELGLTKDQVVIFASIVEREVFREEDKPIVAGILIKRWQNEELIGADATTQYAKATRELCENAVESDDLCPTEEQAALLEWWPEELTVADLRYENPYNTRAVLGLPPSPISNPGLNSIEAVLNYKETSYNYYLTDENGVTHYSNTLEEHNRNVAEYL